MTNEEAVLDLQFLARRYDELDQLYYSINVEAIDIAINSIQENSKLKAEIEQLKLYSYEIINARNLSEETVVSIRMKMQGEILLAREIEFLKEIYEESVKKINQLKSELEQLVKEKSEVISKIEYALDECEPVYNKCAVMPQAKPIYDLAMNYCLDLLKGATNGN